MPNAIETLAAFVASAPRSYRDTAIRRATESILDVIGCMLLGADHPDTQRALRSVQAWGAGDACVVGMSQRLAPPWAALVNGVSAHTFDLDDWDELANSHPSAVLVPALLGACAETPCPGVDLLDAYLVGVEVVARVGDAVNMHHYNLGWHSTATLGGLAAAAACARLKGLDAERAANALSLSTSMSTGYISQFGTSGKPLHAGLAAKAGLLACALADNGATGQRDALDGEVSFSSLLVPDAETRFDTALGKLGDPWYMDERGLVLKIYPACGYNHRAIDGALELKARHHIEPERIARVDVSLPDFYLAILPYREPATATEALFSLPYCVATALVNGRAWVEAFTPEAIHDQSVRDLLGRVETTARVPKKRHLNCDGDDPDSVRVCLEDGAEHAIDVGFPRGHPMNPLGRGELRAKYVDCARYRISTEQAETIAASVAALPDAASTNTLCDALGGLQAQCPPAA